MLKYSDPLDRIFHALADPARRAMVERLVGGPASVGALAESLPEALKMSLPGVFQHLQVLEEAGLVRTEKIGRVRMCHVEPAALRLAEAWIIAKRTLTERRLDRLARVLGEEDSIESVVNSVIDADATSEQKKEEKNHERNSNA